jgi:hypothetical protein
MTHTGQLHVGRLRVAMNEPEDGTLPQVASVTNHSGARRSWGDMAFNTEGAEGLQISRVRRHFLGYLKYDRL